PTLNTASGLAPPAWNVTLSDGSDHVVSADVSGASIFLSVDGTVTSRLISGLTSFAVTGGDGNDSFTIGAGLGSAGIAIAFAGGAGTDTLHGPTTDATWSVTGAGSGTVTGVAFSGFENLSGAAGNNDTFDVSSSGSVSGTVDGGDGGYDVISVES